jgi:hypothetical protein
MITRPIILGVVGALVAVAAHAQGIDPAARGLAARALTAAKPAGVTKQVQYNNNGVFGAAPDFVESANVVSQRNGSSAQCKYVYNTYTDALNYERGGICWVSNVFRLVTESAGTGNARNVSLVNGGSATTWATSGILSVGGGITFNPDNAGDIGQATAARPRNIYATGTLSLGAPATQSGTSYTTGVNDAALSFTSASAVTLTLPSAASFPGRVLFLKETGAGAVSSASSNVVPLAGGSAGTAILTAAGKWAQLHSDGTNWIIMEAN